MATYLKLFKTKADYQQFIQNEKKPNPSVFCIEENNSYQFNPYIPPTVVATYNATSSNLYALRSTTGVEQLFVDDVEVTDFGSSYSFSTEGEHTVKTIFNNKGVIIDNMFSSTTVTSIDINDSVTSIGGYAFGDCSSLTSVTIGLGVTSIGKGAFQSCYGLTSIIIPDSVTSIGWYAFAYCSGLTSIVIPDLVTSIGDYAFYNCSGLTELTIGSGVTSIGYAAFFNCSSLNSITCYATTAPTINQYTFQNVKSNGILYYPAGSNYNSWMNTGSYYLGYYTWTEQILYT